MNNGKVVLIGAGPGDAGLLTVNALKELEKADVVVYDRLVSDSIMALIPETAEKINVGKNVGNHPVPQSKINEILLEKALENKNVIRLKGGDSFVFGRGGEELELLAENDIEFKVIPGITSALSAATYAGIPVTHRDYCSSLHIITGHKKADGALNIDYEALIRLNGTLVFMMSVSNAGEIANGLMENGMQRDMPCAVVENGTRPNQRKLITTIDKLEDNIKLNAIVSPSVILVGKVCTLSEKFDWFSKLPLKGSKILVTKPKMTSNKLITALYELGADIDAVPAIETKPVEFNMPNLEDYTQIVFTSSTGIEAFFDALLKNGKDSRLFYGKKIATVGSETAKKLNDYGLNSDFVPLVYSSGKMMEEMINSNFTTINDKLLLIRGNIASQITNDMLLNHNISFDTLVVYETIKIKAKNKINPNDYEMVTFTSVSSVDSFIENIIPNANLRDITAICIGEQTAAEATKYNMNVMVSKKATIASMVELIKEICSR